MADDFQKIPNRFLTIPTHTKELTDLMYNYKIFKLNYSDSNGKIYGLKIFPFINKIRSGLASKEYIETDDSSSSFSDEDSLNKKIDSAQINKLESKDKNLNFNQKKNLIFKTKYYYHINCNLEIKDKKAVKLNLSENDRFQKNNIPKKQSNEGYFKKISYRTKRMSNIHNYKSTDSSIELYLNKNQEVYKCCTYNKKLFFKFKLFKCSQLYRLHYPNTG
ncbi:uncharacterized protein LOC135924258 isoform X2 [Gordionus sp. m RMFG-2023]|uniref:uncharacterized protein LOC135924258 isoform X2 n=1 Tax=Gordionus sp. m RMFG-2023 TaxID=3053472 RepID=UPI0031FE288B